MLSDPDQPFGPDEPLSEEGSDTFDTVTCDGGCGREVWETATIDIVAGKIVGRWNQPTFHAGVSGIEARSPEHQQYCLDCTTGAGFDVRKPAGEREIAEVNTYLTPSNLLSFFMGALFVFLLWVTF